MMYTKLLTLCQCLRKIIVHNVSTLSKGIFGSWYFDNINDQNITKQLEQLYLNNFDFLIYILLTLSITSIVCIGVSCLLSTINSK